MKIIITFKKKFLQENSIWIIKYKFYILIFVAYIDYGAAYVFFKFSLNVDGEAVYKNEL